MCELKGIRQKYGREESTVMYERVNTNRVMG
jgi:hypothetical protein